MGRPIDADKFEAYMDTYYFDYTLEDIDAQPTVDVVPVVRCKDCWYSSAIPEEMQYYGEWHCEYWGAEMHGNDFCSCGKERKRDEDA